MNLGPVPRALGNPRSDEGVADRGTVHCFAMFLFFLVGLLVWVTGGFQVNYIRPRLSKGIFGQVWKPTLTLFGVLSFLF